MVFLCSRFPASLLLSPIAQRPLAPIDPRSIEQSYERADAIGGRPSNNVLTSPAMSRFVAWTTTPASQTRVSFATKAIPVIFAAVSLDGDHGYVLVQDRIGVLSVLVPRHGER
jgi:hypothetical protein